MRLVGEEGMIGIISIQEALAMVQMSPVRSIEKPVTGLPVLAMPSTILFVHSGSIFGVAHAAHLSVAHPKMQEVHQVKGFLDLVQEFWQVLPFVVLLLKGNRVFG